LNILSWSFTFSSLELSENGLLHIHLILGVKNLTNYTKNIEYNIKLILQVQALNDITIRYLDNFLEIKKAFLYIYKDSEKEYFLHNVNFNINDQKIIASFLDELDRQK